MTTSATPTSAHAIESRKTFVIVGGVAGGMSAATRLRRLDETAHIIVLERGHDVSFANCGLPYHIGGVIPQRSALELQTPTSLARRFLLDVRVRTEAVAIDRAARTITARDLATGTESTIHYDALVLSPGASPVRPVIPGGDRALALRDLSDMDRIIAALDGAKSAVVLGAGFIGLEVAENLRHRGLDVTIVQSGSQIFTPLDPELAFLLQARIAAHGVSVRLNRTATAITDTHVTLNDGTEIPADIVVAAIGVRPDSSLAEGLETLPNGAILVDDQLRTSDPYIWAVGDAVAKAKDGGPGLVPLAGLANRHGRLAADAIAGRRIDVKNAVGTAVIGLFGLTAAVTGASETVLRAQGKSPRVIHIHPFDHATYYPGAKQMTLKLMVDPETDAILGAQGVGEDGVVKRIDVIATAMAGGLTATDLADLELSYAPQFASAKDPINMLGYVNENRADGEQAVQWHEVADRLAEGWMLVDVRTEDEYATRAIEGSTLINLESLRSHLDDLRGQRVIVHCRVGQRGHTAAAILRANGIEVANLDGGCLTYHQGMAALAAARA